MIRDLFSELSGWWTSRNPTDLHPLHPDVLDLLLHEAAGAVEPAGRSVRQGTG